jgi:hypothetical protein
MRTFLIGFGKAVPIADGSDGNFDGLHNMGIADGFHKASL